MATTTRFVTLAAAAAALWLSVAGLQAQRADAFPESRHHPAIRYGGTPPRDEAAAFNAKLTAGEATLTFEPVRGYLKSVLQGLGISPTSQVLVYSQTSFQASHISAANPRAIYFGDNIAVAFIRNAPLIEVAAQDPALGTVFYQISQSEGPSPHLSRSDQCLSCHLSWDTRAVPGPFVLSTFPRKSDREYANGGMTDGREPIDRRWGGWYVTGTQVPPRHMGNIALIGPHAADPEHTAPPPVYASLADTSTVRDVGEYLTPYSDVAALLVLDHQLHAYNLMTRAAWEHRLAVYPAAPAASGAEVLSARVKDAVEELVEYLLFVDEAPLPVVKGSSGFAEWFSAQGPRDPQGRSLRELQLSKRLMKYPLSYTVYSNTFDGMPAAIREASFKRLVEVLTAVKPEAKFAHLTAADRRAVLEILRDTKPDFRPFADGTTAAAR
jgi:hypothetical protein